MTIGHRAGNLDDPDVVVISSAIPAHNVELQEARRRGILVVKRAQALAWLMESGRGIAVCGTHGKTTTTSMITRALVDAGYDPTFLVGGELNDLGSNARHGEGEFVVCEADESDGSLLLLSPEVAVLTNVELDHHSHYLHVEDVERVFSASPIACREHGLFVYCAEDPRVAALAKTVPCRACSYGFDGRGATTRPGRSRRGALGSSFEVWQGDAEARRRSTLQVPGRHNVLERARLLRHAHRAGRGAGAHRGAPGGLQRGGAALPAARASATGSRWWTTTPIIPPSCGPLCRAAREGTWSRVIAVFQPHLYSRTEFLQAEFAEALLEADVAVVTDVYGAREDPMPGRERQADRRQHPQAGRRASRWSTCRGSASVVDYLRRGHRAGRPRADPGRGRRPPGGRALPGAGLGLRQPGVDGMAALSDQTARPRRACGCGPTPPWPPSPPSAPAARPVCW